MDESWTVLRTVNFKSIVLSDFIQDIQSPKGWQNWFHGWKFWFLCEFQIANFLMYDNFRDFSSIQIENNFKSFSWIGIAGKSLFLHLIILYNIGPDISVLVQFFNFDHVLTKTSKICFIIFGLVSKAFEPWG